MFNPWTSNFELRDRECGGASPYLAQSEMSAEDLKALLEQGLGSGGAKDGEEDLRSLLGTLESMNLNARTPPKSGGGSLGSMSVQKQIEERQRQRQSERQQYSGVKPPQPPMSAPGESSSRRNMNVSVNNSDSAAAAAMLTSGNVKFSSGSAFQRFNLMPRDDRMDSTVLTFHSDISFRTKLGRYLTAAPTSEDRRDEKRRDSGVHVRSSSDMSSVAPFLLGVEGQGVGDPLDCFHFLSLDGLGRDYKGPLRYGMTVAPGLIGAPVGQSTRRTLER